MRATANLGRRWVFGPGLNVTARFGAGPGKRTFARGDDAELNAKVDTIEAFINLLPVSLDAELSLGWIF